MGFLPGLRFRKSIGVLPGVKLNVSKTGVSTSLGGKGASVNIGTRTRTVNLGIPGTGLSYRVPLSSSSLVLVVGLLIIVGIAYLIAPDFVRGILHQWQPKLF